MPNIAAVLKDEIRRLAKREIKAETSSIKKAVFQLRLAIAKLKRLLQTLQREIAFLKAQEHKRLSQPQTNEEDNLEGVRHSGRSVKSQRKRLKLNAADFGTLVGVSGVTIYGWESGKGRPKKEHLAALVAVRELGRREAMMKLELAKANATAVNGDKLGKLKRH